MLPKSKAVIEDEDAKPKERPKEVITLSSGSEDTAENAEREKAERKKKQAEEKRLKKMQDAIEIEESSSYMSELNSGEASSSTTSTSVKETSAKESHERNSPERSVEPESAGVPEAPSSDATSHPADGVSEEVQKPKKCKMNTPRYYGIEIVERLECYRGYLETKDGSSRYHVGYFIQQDRLAKRIRERAKELRMDGLEISRNYGRKIQERDETSSESASSVLSSDDEKDDSQEGEAPKLTFKELLEKSSEKEEKQAEPNVEKKVAKEVNIEPDRKQSQYIGVFWNRHSKLWAAGGEIDGKYRVLGSGVTQEEAAQLTRETCRQLRAEGKKVAENYGHIKDGCFEDVTSSNAKSMTKYTGVYLENDEFVSYGYIDGNYTKFSKSHSIEECAKQTRLACCIHRENGSRVEEKYGYMKTVNAEVSGNERKASAKEPPIDTNSKYVGISWIPGRQTFEGWINKDKANIFAGRDQDQNKLANKMRELVEMYRKEGANVSLNFGSERKENDKIEDMSESLSEEEVPPTMAAKPTSKEEDLYRTWIEPQPSKAILFEDDSTTQTYVSDDLRFESPEGISWWEQPESESEDFYEDWKDLVSSDAKALQRLVQNPFENYHRSNKYKGIAYFPEIKKWKAYIYVDSKRHFFGAEHETQEGAALELQEENCRTRNPQRNPHVEMKISHFKGVEWDFVSKKFRATFSHEGSTNHIGYFDDDVRAAQAVDEEAVKKIGKRLNEDLLRKHQAKQSETGKEKVIDPPKTNTTPYDGVFWDSKLKGWRIKIRKASRPKLYETDREAAIATNELYKRKGFPVPHPDLEKEIENSKAPVVLKYECSGCLQPMDTKAALCNKCKENEPKKKFCDRCGTTEDGLVNDVCEACRVSPPLKSFAFEKITRRFQPGSIVDKLSFDDNGRHGIKLNKADKTWNYVYNSSSSGTKRVRGPFLLREEAEHERTQHRGKVKPIRTGPREIAPNNDNKKSMFVGIRYRPSRDTFAGEGSFEKSKRFFGEHECQFELAEKIREQVRTLEKQGKKANDRYGCLKKEYNIPISKFTKIKWNSTISRWQLPIQGVVETYFSESRAIYFLEASDTLGFLDESKREGFRTWSDQYDGVYFDRYLRMWVALLQVEDPYKKVEDPYKHSVDLYGGTFGTEVEAAKAVNNLCRINNYPISNPALEHKNVVKSKYKCVYWNPAQDKWQARVVTKDKAHNIGLFKSEREAALAVNAKCEELEIEVRNPNVDESGECTNDSHVASPADTGYVGVYKCDICDYYFGTIDVGGDSIVIPAGLQAPDVARACKKRAEEEQKNGKTLGRDDYGEHKHVKRKSPITVKLEKPVEAPKIHRRKRRRVTLTPQPRKRRRSFVEEDSSSSEETSSLSNKRSASSAELSEFPERKRRKLNKRDHLKCCAPVDRSIQFFNESVVKNGNDWRHHYRVRDGQNQPLEEIAEEFSEDLDCMVNTNRSVITQIHRGTSFVPGISVCLPSRWKKEQSGGSYDWSRKTNLGYVRSDQQRSITGVFQWEFYTSVDPFESRELSEVKIPKTYSFETNALHQYRILTETFKALEADEVYAFKKSSHAGVYKLELILTNGKINFGNFMTERERDVFELDIKRFFNRTCEDHFQWDKSFESLKLGTFDGKGAKAETVRQLNWFCKLATKKYKSYIQAFWRGHWYGASVLEKRPGFVFVYFDDKTYDWVVPEYTRDPPPSPPNKTLEKDESKLSDE